MDDASLIPEPISAVVPARNEEATIAACVESLAQQREIAEIFVVNDQSSDRTAEIVRDLMARNSKVRLLESGDLPAGWVGKNHAVWLGARQAKGSWLLFTDADVVHDSKSAATALGIANGAVPSGRRTVRSEGAVDGPSFPQLISFSPEQVMETWYERALIPVVYCRLGSKFSYDEVNDPGSSAAAANGQFLMISRQAYDAVGGHAAIAGEVLEDVSMAQSVKAAGYGIWFGSGQGIVKVRMYRSFPAMWEGWKKNLYRLMGGQRGPIVAELVNALVPLVLLLFSVVLLWAGSGNWHTGLISAAVGLGLWQWMYALELHRNGFASRLVWYGLPGKLLFAAVLLASCRNYQKGRLAWKGREYPVGTSSASKR